jgi:hypothetical protein
MKTSIFLKLFTSALLISLISCSTTDKIHELVAKSYYSQNIMPTNNSGIYSVSVKVPSYSNTKRRQSALDSLAALRKLLYKKPDEVRIFYRLNGEVQKKLPLDSTKNIYLSFDVNIPNISYEVKAIHFWDYSNYRFLVPFLTLGNEIHKRNQCVNRAIEVCNKNNIDGIIISPTLNHFILFKTTNR